MWQRGASALRTEPALVAFVALAAIAYSVFSLVRYEQFAHGFDLAIFDQVVWHYSRFEAPASSVKNLESIWGDHFSPILALLGPLYWIWEDARMLLLAQALLLAIERRRWGAYFPLLIALLCVKEGMSILAVFLGIYVMTYGALRKGLVTMALGWPGTCSSSSC